MALRKSLINWGRLATSLHFVAASYKHCIKRNDVLRRMIVGGTG